MNPGNFPGHGFISPWIQAPPGLGQQINSPPQAFLVGFGAWNSPTVFVHPSMNLAANSPPSLNPALNPSLNQSLNPALSSSLNPSPHQFSQRFRPPLLEDNPPAPPLPPAMEYPPLPSTSVRFVSQLERDRQLREQRSHNDFNASQQQQSYVRRDDLWAAGQLQLDQETPVPPSARRDDPWAAGETSLPSSARRDDPWAAGETSMSQSTRRDDPWATGESSLPSSATRRDDLWAKGQLQSNQESSMRRDDLWATGETSLPSSTRRNDLWATGQLQLNQESSMRRDDLWAAGQLQLNQESSMPSQLQRMNVGPRKQPLLDDYYLDAAGPRPPPIPSPQPVPPPPPRIETVSISDLLYPPGRSLRPPKVLLIFRGVPGSGKTHVAKLIKEKEMELGGVAPRILSLDDYFMVENERDVKDPITGRRSKEKCMDYEFDRALEDSYRKQMLKAFRKTVRFFFRFRFFFVFFFINTHSAKKFRLSLGLGLGLGQDPQRVTALNRAPLRLCTLYMGFLCDVD